MEFSSFLYDPVDVGNLMFDSCALSKYSLNMWKLSVHVLLKPSLESFEHYFASQRDECSCAVVWAFFGIAFLWDWNENWCFPALGPPVSFPNLLAYWVQNFCSIIFQIWSSSPRIPSPPVALFVAMLLRPTGLRVLACLALGQGSHHHGYLGH